MISGLIFEVRPEIMYMCADKVHFLLNSVHMQGRVIKWKPWGFERGKKLGKM